MVTDSVRMFLEHHVEQGGIYLSPYDLSLSIKVNCDEMGYITDVKWLYLHMGPNLPNGERCSYEIFRIVLKRKYESMLETFVKENEDNVHDIFKYWSLECLNKRYFDRLNKIAEEKRFKRIRFEKIRDDLLFGMTFLMGHHKRNTSWVYVRIFKDLIYKRLMDNASELNLYDVDKLFDRLLTPHDRYVYQICNTCERVFRELLKKITWAFEEIESKNKLT